MDNLYKKWTMDDLTKKWTTSWHAVMDEELGPDPFKDKIGKRFTDPDRDFRLHFDFWSLSDAGKRKCFEMLPLGSQLAERLLDKHPWETNMIITETDAEEMLRSAIGDLSILTELDISNDDPIKIIHGREDELNSLEAKPFIDYWLTREIWDQFFNKAPEEYQKSYRFVSETLYQATKYSEGVFHTLRPYVELPENIDPFANLLRMYRSEIRWLKSKNGLIVFYNQDAPINDGASIDLELNGRGLQEISDRVVEWVEQRKEHHLKRGFPPERLKECTIGVSGSEPYQIVLRDVDDPETGYDGELPYTGQLTIKDGVLYTRQGYGLFIDGQKDGAHTEKINISTHYKNGKFQK